MDKKTKKAYMKAYYIANKELIKKSNEAHKKEKKAYDKARNIKNRAKDKKHRQLRKKQIAIAGKNYRENNGDMIRTKRRVYARKKWKTSPAFRINNNMRAAIRKTLKDGKKGRHWFDLVGYSYDDLKKHLQKQFKEGMSWANYGQWHIDHITPKSVFNFTKPEHRDFKKCWALSNLQPMWGNDNISKSNNLTEHFQPSLLI